MFSHCSKPLPNISQHNEIAPFSDLREGERGFRGHFHSSFVYHEISLTLLTR